MKDKFLQIMKEHDEIIENLDRLIKNSEKRQAKLNKKISVLIPLTVILCISIAITIMMIL